MTTPITDRDPGDEREGDYHTHGPGCTGNEFCSACQPPREPERSPEVGERERVDNMVSVVRMHGFMGMGDGYCAVLRHGYEMIRLGGHAFRENAEEDACKVRAFLHDFAAALLPTEPERPIGYVHRADLRALAEEDEASGDPMTTPITDRDPGDEREERSCKHCGEPKSAHAWTPDFRYCSNGKTYEPHELRSGEERTDAYERDVKALAARLKTMGLCGIIYVDGNGERVICIRENCDAGHPPDPGPRRRSPRESEREALIADVSASAAHFRAEMATTDPRFVSDEWHEVLALLDRCLAALRAPTEPERPAVEGERLREAAQFALDWIDAISARAVSIDKVVEVKSHLRSALRARPTEEPER